MIIDVDEVMNMVMAMSDDGTTCCTRMLDEGNLHGSPPRWSKTFAIHRK